MRNIPEENNLGRKTGQNLLFLSSVLDEKRVALGSGSNGGEEMEGEKELTSGKNIAYCTPIHVLGTVGLHLGMPVFVAQVVQSLC